MRWTGSKSQTMYTSHFCNACRLFSPHPSNCNSFDAVILCWPLIIMNFLFLISFQSFSLVYKSRRYLLMGVRQIFYRWFMSPIWTSSAFTFFTISDSIFRIIYSSLAISYCEICIENVCIPKRKDEVHVSHNSFWVAMNFSNSGTSSTSPHPWVSTCVRPDPELLALVDECCFFGTGSVASVVIRFRTLRVVRLAGQAVLLLLLA